MPSRERRGPDKGESTRVESESDWNFRVLRTSQSYEPRLGRTALHDSHVVRLLDWSTKRSSCDDDPAYCIFTIEMIRQVPT